ncbi:TRAP transporter TatT component family protein [Halobacteriovorax sp. HLS]|uniref:TRAP transporter TatT component family protein n=1 Tax=Halobacteriovorax sp. HLS TaxID=2234000 RepID=UPI000FD8B7BF|nr:TRAP transporter TatT component family protein [Halobacteriovorax sp. HLS]
MSRNSIYTKVLSIFTLILVTACGGIQKAAVGTTGSLMYEATKGLETEGNWHNFKVGTLPNLLLVDGLLSLKPDDRELLVTAIKGYTGYAFAINETEYLKDYFEEKEKSVHKDQAIINYAKAFSYGQRLLLKYGVSWDDLLKSQNQEGGVEKLLEDNLREDQPILEGVLFSAQALGGMINLQKTDMSMVALLPIVKGMFDWVCHKEPDINFGACQIFDGTYAASRPKMLGGDPEKGKEIFLKLIAKNPENWLARLAFVQYYVIPMSEEDDYKTQKFFLETASRNLAKELRGNPKRKIDKAFTQPRLRLYQSLAVKRYEIIKQYEDDLF